MGIEIIREVQASDVNASVWNLFRFAVANVIKEVVGKDWPESELIELHSNHLAVLLHMQPNVTPNEALEQARKLADRMTQYVYKYLKIGIKVGIGTLKRKWQEIADSTEEAFYELSTKNLIDIDKSTNRSTHQLIRPIRFYQQLASAIKHSQEHQAKKVIREHMDQLRNKKDVTPTYLHFLGTELWAILAYSLYDVGIFLDEIFPNIDIRKEMNGISKPDQLADWLIEKVQVICGNRQWNENLKHKRVVEFIIQFIHEHYAEDITLNKLANQVSFSRNYLGQIFKNATGETFNSYLTKVRMEKAKSMILEGKYFIYEVAEKVGYKNIPYFSTLFKKYTGLNPIDLVK
jgi:two-component system response regulator YesN